MPNGIDLDLMVFTQWSAQQGGGILQPLVIGKTLTRAAKTQHWCVLAKN